MAHTRVVGDRWRYWPKEDSATQRPPMMTPMRMAKPTSETWVILPGWTKRSHRPMQMAIGIVMPTLKTPQGDSASALTQTIARTARTIMSMTRTTTVATTPPIRPISSVAIWPSERPPRRIEKNRTSMSWTAPARTTPRMIQSVPGR